MKPADKKFLRGVVFVLGVFLSRGGTALEAQETGAGQVFEVRATAVNSMLIDAGRVKSEKDRDEVVYQVNLPEKSIKRTAVYQSKTKEGIHTGVQADDTVYTIAYHEHDRMKNQKIIKAVGQVGDGDGFEVLVIGEDFVTTSRSTKSYFEVAHYERTDALAQRFRRRNQHGFFSRSGNDEKQGESKPLWRFKKKGSKSRFWR